ncbi:hypothetical protein [Methylorubrum podarium]|uniref:hypothetical protein n=1 Tax=Methylorubrum podarium TaxID=200476 RepID=UPI001EE19CA6|nr:hypothetical protein [Methylorubrum podarium]GJE71695.1 hypothetical protein CHKEEEPN_3242 [Methylorubrum podarium]
MLLETLLALTILAPRIEPAIDAARARLPALPRGAAAEPAPAPSFSQVARAVSNWRDQASENLAPGSLAFVVRHAATEPGFVARCVRLNNYWCIKQAGWSGELGGDAEGHTGFATAADGADAAAQLLRRYQRDFGRRSALAIVRRWAPAECGLPRPVVAPAARSARRATGAVSKTVAPQGIGGTLRARFLARHGRGGVARAAPSAAGGLRVQPWSARARLAGHPGRASRAVARPAVARPAVSVPKPAADIATGITGTTTREAAATPKVAHMAAATSAPPASVFRSSVSSGAANPAALLAPDRLAAEAAALPSIAASLPKGSLLDLSLPAPVCSNDETRIRNYAARIAGSVGLKPDDDLRLFLDDGRPTANLLPVMLAMSSVELGTLHASKALVSAAIARLEARLSGTASSESRPNPAL